MKETTANWKRINGGNETWKRVLTFKVVRRLGVGRGVIFSPVPSASFFVDTVESAGTGRVGATTPESPSMSPVWFQIFQILTIVS